MHTTMSFGEFKRFPANLSAMMVTALGCSLCNARRAVRPCSQERCRALQQSAKVLPCRCSRTELPKTAPHARLPRASASARCWESRFHTSVASSAIPRRVPRPNRFPVYRRLIAGIADDASGSRAEVMKLAISGSGYCSGVLPDQSRGTRDRVDARRLLGSASGWKAKCGSQRGHHEQTAICPLGHKR